MCRALLSSPHGYAARCSYRVRTEAGVSRDRANFGGAVANVTVFAACAGARVALASGAGDDSWGRWLRDRLASEGVDVSLFAMVASV